MKYLLLCSALLVAACDDSDPSSDIEIDQDLTGSWLGCADDSCREHTMAGFHFEKDGRVRNIRGNAQGERCIWTHPVFSEAYWEWRNDQPVIYDIVGIGDAPLRFHGPLLEVPVQEFEPGFLFSLPSEYPDSEWMGRVTGIPECPSQ